MLSKDKLYYRCFSCGFHGDIFNLIGIKDGITDKTEQFKHAYQIFGFYTSEKNSGNQDYFRKTVSDSIILSSAIEKQPETLQNEVLLTDYTAYFEECHARAGKTDYFSFRGLSKSTIDSFNLGFDSDWRSPKALRDGKNPPVSSRIIIPTSKYSYLARATDKNEQKYKAVKEGSSEIFNVEALYNYAVVFIVEGEINALSIIEAGGQAIALGSTANKNKFISVVSQKKPESLLILSLDNDDAGRKTQAEMAHALKSLRITFLEVNISER